VQKFDATWDLPKLQEETCMLHLWRYQKQQTAKVATAKVATVKVATAKVATVKAAT